MRIHDIDHAREEVDRIMNIAQQHGRLMAAVFFVDRDGQLFLTRTSYDFPSGRFGEAIGLLAGNLMEERSREKAEPLKLAAIAEEAGITDDMDDQ